MAWIDLKDQKPRVSKTVLVSTNYGYFAGHITQKGNWYSQFKERKVRLGPEDIIPTHWMEIPEKTGSCWNDIKERKPPLFHPRGRIYPPCSKHVLVSSKAGCFVAFVTECGRWLSIFMSLKPSMEGDNWFPTHWMDIPEKSTDRE